VDLEKKGAPYTLFFYICAQTFFPPAALKDSAPRVICHQPASRRLSRHLHVRRGSWARHRTDGRTDGIKTTRHDAPSVQNDHGLTGTAHSSSRSAMGFFFSKLSSSETFHVTTTTPPGKTQISLPHK
jgi:hypothetical protein